MDRRSRFKIFFSLALFIYTSMSFASEIRSPVLKAILGFQTMPEKPLTIMSFMYSYHIMEPKYRDSSGGHSNNNPMLAITYKGIFAGTFVNSFGIRSYSLGFQRYWFETSSRHQLRFALGYRLGLIYGYGGLTRQPYRFFCYDQPFLPFAQFVSDLTYQHAGLELGFTMNVLSGSAYLRF